jgi:dihydroceramide fatty acyl 2-hydroxylase
MSLANGKQGVRYRYLIIPFVGYAPLTGGLFLWACRDVTIPDMAKPLWIVAGVLVWTLLEYLMHRFLLHSRPQTGGLATGLERLHLGHHRDPSDEAKITIPISGSLPIAGGLMGLFRLTTGGWGMAALLMSGCIAGYLYYEAMHFWIHRGGRGGRWLGPLRAHHLSHHFKDQTRWLGVSTPLWDLVMGTHRLKP